MSPKEMFLDIGCGLGRPPAEPNSGDEMVISLDRSLETLKRNPSCHQSTLPICAEAQNLPFRKNAFDTIRASHLLEHLPDPANCIEEAERCLKEKGRLLVAVPHPRFESVMHVLVKKYHSPAMHQQIFSTQEIKKLVENAGFEIEVCQTQKWWNACGIILKAILYRLNFIGFEKQLGFTPVSPRLKKSPIGTILKKVDLGLNQTFVGRFLNRFFPCETYLEASRRTSTAEL